MCLYITVAGFSKSKSKDLREHNGRENSKKYTLKTIEILILWDIMKKKWNTIEQKQEN